MYSEKGLFFNELEHKCETTALWNSGRSVWPLPRYVRIHYWIMHVRALITRRIGCEFSHPLSLSLFATLSFFPSLLLSFVFRKPRIEFIKNSTGSLWDDRDEEKVNATNAFMCLWCRMMLRFSLLRLEILLTPTDFIPNRLIDGDKHCNRERKKNRIEKRERERKREKGSRTFVRGIVFINPRNSRDRFRILSVHRFPHCSSVNSIYKYEVWLRMLVSV